MGILISQHFTIFYLSVNQYYYLYYNSLFINSSILDEVELFLYAEVMEKAEVSVFYGKQGEAMGKAGVIEVNVSCEGWEPKKVQIAGEAVRAGTVIL
jgi:hypothetical protein